MLSSKVVSSVFTVRQLHSPVEAVRHILYFQKTISKLQSFRIYLFCYLVQRWYIYFVYYMLLDFGDQCICVFEVGTVGNELYVYVSKFEYLLYLLYILFVYSIESG